VAQSGDTAPTAEGVFTYERNAGQRWHGPERTDIAARVHGSGGGSQYSEMGRRGEDTGRSDAEADFRKSTLVELKARWLHSQNRPY
jgi:hypothetical protein